MENSVVVALDPLGGLARLIYPDGSEMFGPDLEEYDKFMAAKFGSQWKQNRNNLRLCHFDAFNPPPKRDVPKDGEPTLDPREFKAVYLFDKEGVLIRTRFSDGSELFGAAIAEVNAMKKEKFGAQWEANNGKLMARRADAPDWNLGQL